MIEISCPRLKLEARHLQVISSKYRQYPRSPTYPWTVHGHPIHGHSVPGYVVLTDTDHLT